MAEWCHCRRDERGIPWLHHRAAGCLDVVLGIGIERTEGQNPGHLGTNPPVDIGSLVHTTLTSGDIKRQEILGEWTVDQNDRIEPE